MGEGFDMLLVNLKPAGTYPTDFGGDLYSIAVREWVAHQIRRRGHTDTTRGMIRGTTFDYDEPYGSDVTPASPKVVSIVCEFEDKSGGHWTKDGYRKHEEPLDFHSPSQFVVECVAIVTTLRERGWVNGWPADSNQEKRPL